MAVTPSSVEQLVSRIEAAIVNGEVEPGSVLGTESELCLRYGVSQATFRQVARVLEASDLAVSRPGNGGGLLIQGYSLVGAAKAIATYLEFAGVGLSEMLAISSTFFRLGVRLSADRMSVEDLDQLRERLDEFITSPLGFPRGLSLLELFQRIMTASGNPIVALVSRLSQHSYVNIAPFERLTPEQFQFFGERLLPLMDALLARDMDRLDVEVERSLRMHTRYLTEAAAAPDRSGAGLDRVGHNSPRTLSEQLAHAMLRDIQLLGWPVGQRLGTEPELMLRYGVSRATLRQSVRQLEQYFAVRSRRGPGGGIFVTTPDPERAQSLAVNALRHAHVEWRDIQAVAPDMVSIAVDLAVASPEGEAYLAAVFRQASEASNDDVYATVQLMRVGLGKASGNMMLRLLLDLMAKLETELARPTQPADMPRLQLLLSAAAASLSAGDKARAKRAAIEVARRYGLAGHGRPQP